MLRETRAELVGIVDLYSRATGNSGRTIVCHQSQTLPSVPDSEADVSLADCCLERSFKFQYQGGPNRSLNSIRPSLCSLTPTLRHLSRSQLRPIYPHATYLRYSFPSSYSPARRTQASAIARPTMTLTVSSPVSGLNFLLKDVP